MQFFLALGGLVSAVLGRVFAAGVVRWIATKTLGIFLLVNVLPWVLTKVFYGGLPFISDTVRSALSSFGASPVVAEFSGLGAFLLVNLRVDDCFQIFLSALIIKGTLSLARVAVSPKIT